MVFYDVGEVFVFVGVDYVDELVSGEDVDCEFLVECVVSCVGGVYFGEVVVWGDFGFFEVIGCGFVGFVWVDGFVGDLDGGVVVFFD